MNFKREDTVVTKNKGTQVEDVLSTPKRSQDMLTKAKNKFFNIGEALKTNKLLNGEVDHQKKSRTQATLDYLFKPCPHKVDRNSAIANVAHKESPKRALSLQKQNSVGAYPITIDIIRSESCEKEKSVHDDFHDFNFPAGLHEKSDEYRETAALALERPRKKLSFREPEIFVYSFKDKQRGAKKLQYSGTKTSVLRTNNLRQSSSCENIQLESQAMRVVRTVGQAFEVCHKLSINAPEAEHDEHETLTQDLLSDHISDAMSDKPKKDYIIEATSDKHSLPIEENILEDLNFNDTNKLLRIPPTDTLTSPTTTNCNRKMVSGETYASHVIDEFQTGGSGSGSMANTNVFSTGSAVSTQHEIQLLKEQLEQQSQQTQAALAQLQLVREQLATEQSARMEAQARTHQLLVHNKELLDHIAALVSHLQGGEQISAQQNTGPHVAMPQQHQNTVDGYLPEQSESSPIDQNQIIQNYGIPSHSLFDNRVVTSCLPSSPLRSNFNPAGSMFNFPSYSSLQETTFEGQLLQRLQALGSCPTSQYPFNYQPLMTPNLYATPPLLNSVYSLQPPPQKKLTTSPLATMKPFGGSPLMDKRPSPVRGSDFQLQHEKLAQSSLLLPNQQKTLSSQTKLPNSPNTQRRETQFIKPLSQLGTLTTTDVQGKVRMIVPIPSRSPDDGAGNLLASLKISDDIRPAITRSTSEKVPNRSELMSQVQRTAWARHTTK